MSSIKKTFQKVAVLAWDTSLTLKNILMPKRSVGKVIPEGHPGFSGKWPEYVAPKEGDSRCSCPALNALANHGIFPHDGKNISFKEMTDKVTAAYNVSPTLSLVTPAFAADMLGRDYKTDKLDLGDLNLHSDASIEHDASLLRQDVHFEPDLGKIHLPYVKELLESASGKDADGNPLVTLEDLSSMLSKRRAESRATNPEFSLSKGQDELFSPANAGSLNLVFGGRVKDLEVFLTEERIPDGWESRIRESSGLTIRRFNNTAKKIGEGIDESKFLQNLPQQDEKASA